MSNNVSGYVKKDLPKSLTNFGVILLVIGLIAGIAGYFIDTQRAAFGYLSSFMFLASLGVGSLFLMALEFIAGADWSVPFRRVSEFIGSLLPLLLILVIPLILNMHNLFHWTDKEAVLQDRMLQSKSPYLNISFFVIRVFVILIVWNLFYFFLVRNSHKQDQSKDQSFLRKNIIASGLFMPVFAVTISIFAVDFMMSLEPHWYSTMFGVYYFSGTVWCALAALTLYTVKLKENGYLHPKINTDHYYSLGTLLFAFTCFWGYIAFSQYMLIWYADIPEENFWFLHRWEGGWAALSILLILIHFIIPFFALLSHKAKTNPARLKFMSIWILAAHFIDVYWLVMPNMSNVSSGYFFSWIDIAYLLTAIGLVIILFNYNSKKYNMVPTGDPKLERGLEFSLHEREIAAHE